MKDENQAQIYFVSTQMIKAIPEVTIIAAAMETVFDLTHVLREGGYNESRYRFGWFE